MLVITGSVFLSFVRPLSSKGRGSNDVIIVVVVVVVDRFSPLLQNGCPRGVDFDLAAVLHSISAHLYLCFDPNNHMFLDVIYLLFHHSNVLNTFANCKPFGSKKCLWGWGGLRRRGDVGRCSGRVFGVSFV